MIVYRKKEEVTSAADCLKRLSGMLEGLREGPAHEEVTALLLEWGEFESALTDALMPECDTLDDTAALIKKGGVETGRILLASWESSGREIPETAAKLDKILKDLSSRELPKLLSLRETEGFAHYGLYPETYIEAARAFAAETETDGAVCLGLRSIGAALSSVVCATLEAGGVEAEAATLRPRGHPFDRRVRLDDRLASYLSSLEGRHFLIIDEGPGKSGSSLCGAADALSSIGIPDERIVFIAGWLPTRDWEFVSGDARRRWDRHRKYAGSFDRLWVKSGRLFCGWGDGAYVNLSGGLWRGRFFKDREAPPVHPFHEKLKYLLPRPKDAGGAVMLRFAGHGRYGFDKYRRALYLAETGLIQPVLGFSNGLIAHGVKEGAPLGAEEADRSLLDTIANYLAFISTEFKSRKDAAFDDMLSMIRRNVFLSLGKGWIKKLSGIERFREMYDEGVPVEVDGRMLPHEWIRTDTGFVKSDSFDHHADQFFPCCQEIAWDIAGTIAEFGLDEAKAGYLVAEFERLTGEKFIWFKLKFYMIAYLAYRTGYSFFAAEELSSSGESQGFSALFARYRRMLANEIERFSQGGKAV